MANPQFFTRIQLKYDTWANWNTEAALAKVPLKGEVCLVEVPSGAATGAGQATPPSVLMKVGDGTKTFAQLPWLSALSADVHAWAKKSESEFLSWLDTTGKFATDAELSTVDGKVTALANRVAPLETAKTNHETRIGDLEAALGTGGSTENSISKRVEALEEDMETVLGAATVAGSIAEAKKAGTDAAAAASTADGKAVAAQNAVDAVERVLSGYTAEGSVSSAIAEAKKAGTDAQAAVDVVEEILEGYTTKGSVKSAINGLDQRLDAAEGAITNHTTQLATLTGDVNTAGSVDYKIAQEVAKIINDNDAADIDTLEEIASWITNDTTGAAGMAKDITALKAVTEGYSGSKAIQNAINSADGKAVAAQNAVDAVELQLAGIAAGNGTVKAAIDAAAKKGEDAQADVDAVEKVLSGYTTEGSVKSAIEAAANAASTADGKAVAAANNSFVSASVSGKVITLTKGNGTSETLTTQDTTYSAATSSVLGLVKSASSTSGDVEVDANGFMTVKDNSHNHTVENITGLSGQLTSLDNRLDSAEEVIGASTDTASKTGTLYARVAKAQADAETGISNANTAQTGVNTLSGLVGTKGDAATVDTAFGRIAKAQAAAEAAAGAATGAQNAANAAQGAVDAVELQLVGMAATSGSVKSAIDAAAAKGQGAQDAVDAVELQLTGIAAGSGTVKAAIDAVDGKVTNLSTKVDNLTLDQIDANTAANYVVFNCGSASVLI